MRRFIAIACLLVGVPTAGYAAAFTVEHHDRPAIEQYCPEEDSCARPTPDADYHDGRWWVPVSRTQ